MSTQDKLFELAEEAVEIIKELMKRTEEKTQLANINYNECGDTIIFTLNNNKTIEYSLSELAYIFEDDLEKIINSERAQNIYNGFSSRNACEELCKRCSVVRRF